MVLERVMCMAIRNSSNQKSFFFLLVEKSERFERRKTRGVGENLFIPFPQFISQRYFERQESMEELNL